MPSHLTTAPAFGVLDTIPLGIFVLDSGYRIRFWNECLEHWTGVLRSEILDLDARPRFPALAAPGYSRRIEDVFRRGVPAVFSPQLHPPLIRCELKPDALRIPYTTVTSMPDPVGSGFLAVVSIQDITDLTRRLAETRSTAKELAAELARRLDLEKDLYKAKEAAEQGSRAKSQFLAVMSHEMRTPLNGILGMAEMLLHSDLSAEQSEMAETMHHSGRLLLSLINDSLDMAKIEAGQLTIERVGFDLRAIVEESVKLLSPEAKGKGIRLHYRMAPEIPEKVTGDPTRVRQILLNLLGNAVKFTERGEVRLQISAKPPGGDGAHVLFEVIDTGIGIEEGVQQQLFRPFVQADASTTRRFGGTGLGLSVCKRLTELMGGEIGVESRLGEGSRFWFIVRFDSLAQEAPIRAPAKRDVVSALTADSPRLLVAEDNFVNQRVAVRMLESLGYRVEVVENGLEAVDAVRRNEYAAVLMDCSMPGMDGYQATIEIRRMEGSSRRTPIIALTANAYADAAQLIRAAGMDDFLAKPIELRRLAEVIERVRLCPYATTP